MLDRDLTDRVPLKCYGVNVQHLCPGEFPAVQFYQVCAPYAVRACVLAIDMAQAQFPRSAKFNVMSIAPVTLYIPPSTDGQQICVMELE